MNTQLDFNQIDEIERKSRKVRSEVVSEMLVQTAKRIQLKCSELAESKRVASNRVGTKTLEASAR